MKQMKLPKVNFKGHLPFVLGGVAIVGIIWYYHHRRLQQTTLVHNAMPAAYPAFNQSQNQNQSNPSGVQCQCPDGSISQAMLGYVPDEFMESPEMAQSYLSYAFAGHKKGGHGKGKGGKGGHGSKGGHAKGGGAKGGKGGGKGGKGGGYGGGGGSGGGGQGGGGGGQDSGGQDGGAADGGDQGGQDGGGFGGGGGRHGHGQQGGQPGAGGGGQSPVLTCNCPPNDQSVSSTGGSGFDTGGGGGGMPLPPGPGTSMGQGMFNPTLNQWQIPGTTQPFGNVPNMAFAAHSGEALPLFPASEDVYDDYGAAYPGYIMATTLAGPRVSPFQEQSNTTPFVHPPIRSRFAGRPANYG